MSVLIRDGALEYLHDEVEKQLSEIDDLTQELINMTVRAEAAEAQLARIMADRTLNV
jgi:prefoldin subunit 5